MISIRSWDRWPLYSWIGWIQALVLVWAGTTAMPSPGIAAEQEYFLNDPQKLSAASLVIDSRLLPIRGHVSGFEGSIRFDPESPEGLYGEVRIPVQNLRFGSLLTTEEILSDRWLDAATYPEIDFVVKAVRDMKQISEHSWSFTARSAMVIRGRAGGLEFPATIEFVPNGMTERTNGRIDGDLIVMRGGLGFRPALWGLEGESSIIGGFGGLLEIDFSAIGYTMRSGRK